MNRVLSGPPQTPSQNDDVAERSMRRMNSSNRHASLTDVARRVQDSPLHDSATVERRRRISGQFLKPSNPENSQRPVTGNYSEWMKMVRMRQVKANNAFAIPLIDAFHGLIQGELLSQDGHSVTFQEATHTLGGCLTVYKNRIARVKDDTSKLLVGVTEKKNVETDSDSGNEDNDENSDENDDDSLKASKKRSSKVKSLGDSDAFLASNAKLEIDTNELATTIDPLLRKMSADFDKRGAQALLQYSLKLGEDGRLLLDAGSQDVSTKVTPPAKETKDTHNRLPRIVEDEEGEELVDDKENLVADPLANADDTSATDLLSQNTSSQANMDSLVPDLAFLNVNYFSRINLSQKEVLPLVDSIAKAVANPTNGTGDLLRDMRAWELTDPGDNSTYGGQDSPASPEEGDGSDAEDDHAENNGLGLNFDALEVNDFEFDDPANDVQDGQSEPENVSVNSIVSSRLPVSGNWMDVSYLQKLDSQQNNWAGPSFWKIKRLQAKNLDPAAEQNNKLASKEASKEKRRLANAPTVVDFFSEDEVDIETLFAPKRKAITLSTKQYLSSTKHLLPVDMKVTTKHLLSLQLRPKSGIANAFRRGGWNSQAHEDNSLHYSAETNDDIDTVLTNADASVAASMHDQDFFYGGWDEANEARPITASQMFTQSTQTGYGSQSNQIGFARVAKRIDIRRLKDNVWNSIKSGVEAAAETPKSLIQVIGETQPLYNDQQRADLSPAMYFISLLHLTNEKGMQLRNTDTLTDVEIFAH